jgi:Ankyrin repeats (3 copies)
MEIIELLLSKGADINEALHFGCELGDKERVELLLEMVGADVNRVDENYITLLHLACWKGYKEIADLLIEKGANYDDVFYISEYLEKFIEYPDVQEYLNSGDHDELLIKYLDDIFMECSNLRKYIKDNRPIERFPQFYPIAVSIRPGGIIQITCDRCNLEHDNLEIFKQLAPHFKVYPGVDIRVTYRGEDGIDLGGYVVISSATFSNTYL